VSADLVSGVTSLEELVTVSQIGVIATAQTSKQEPNAVDPTIVATIQSFTIDEIVWGKISQSSLEVKFTGGVVDRHDGRYLLQLEGQPQFRKGNQYFLVLLGPSPDGTYMLLGGPQGRYDVVNGRLFAVEGTEVTDSVIASLNGAELRAVTKELATIAAAPR
jgi:hypothetical protein